MFELSSRSFQFSSTAVGIGTVVDAMKEIRSPACSGVSVDTIYGGSDTKRALPGHYERMNGGLHLSDLIETQSAFPFHPTVENNP